MKKNLRLIALFIVLSVALSGCQSMEFYQERAVNRARAYLLNECRTLTLEQREYVKFNKPLIMSESILGRAPLTSNSSGGDITANSYIEHFCIAWVIPEQEKLYMVYGVSSRSMEMWFPERLIIKNFIKPKPLYTAFNAGRNFVLQTLLMLPRADVNRIRFSNPAVEATNYELDLTPEGKKTTPQQLANLKKLFQYSLIWDSTDGTNKILVIGMGNPHKGDWKPFSSINISPEVLQKLIISRQEDPWAFEDELWEIKDGLEEKPQTDVEKMLELLETQPESDAK